MDWLSDMFMDSDVGVGWGCWNDYGVVARGE